VLCAIGERFGKWPHEVAEQPAELLRLLNIEAQGKDDHDGR
jgi:hypothetical protein